MIAIAVLVAIALAAFSGVPGAFMHRTSRVGERLSTTLLVVAAVSIVALVAVALVVPALAASAGPSWILGARFGVTL